MTGILRSLSILLVLPLVVTAATAVSPRNANYTIQARLDPATHEIAGRQVLDWTNIQAVATSELRFHLYWNAWRNNRSTWMLEDRIRGRSDLDGDPGKDDWSWLEIDAIRWMGLDGSDPVDLSPGMHHASPDDGNPDDRTVLVVPLPQSVQPGESIRVEMEFRAKVPSTFARTGRIGEFYLIAHWFPKLGVLEEGGWNCHQFHASTEFFSDYGVYDVKITLPSKFVLGATGREVAQDENSDGTKTHHYRQEDVHGFAWTASPHYQEARRRFEVPGLPAVDMRLLIQPEHVQQADRHFDATSAALEHYGRWYGPYPYSHLTIVDPAYGSEAGGMEYPTLFTCGTRLINPFGGDSPESVIVHEAGHQFWYGLVGNNEFSHAWLDEGLNTFSTMRTLNQAYPPRILIDRYLEPWDGHHGLFALRFPDIENPRWIRRLRRYRAQAAAELPSRDSFRYLPGAGGAISYDKTALWLATLERHLGWEVLREILSTFFERYRFRHPTPEQFFAVANEVSDQDLSWFFDQVYRDSVSFDYAVSSAESEAVPLEGWDDELSYIDEDDEEDVEIYRTEVIVKRRGGGRFPVDVLLRFEDGHEIRERWDDDLLWRLFVVERESKLEYAEVDPEGVLMLDLNRLNNSRLLERDGELPAAKWSSKWMIWVQDMMSTLAFFI